MLPAMAQRSVAAAICMALAGPASAQGASAFDGTWGVILTCTAARDGAAGYTFRFLASVQGGVLHGERGVRGQASSLSLDGRIQPDGAALLVVQGLTGNTEYTVGRVAPTTPYSYRMQSRFDTARGTGARTELRPCDAVFTKQ